MLNTKKSLIALATAGIILASPCFAGQVENIEDLGTKNNMAIRMVFNECIPSKQVDVHVNHDTIQLAGFVDNKDQYGAVQELANKYTDDYTIINNVKILSVKDNKQDESRLRADVSRQLKDYKYPVDSIDVQVRNGQVILSGFVNKHVSLKDLKKVAKSVPGVKSVDNYVLYKHT